MIVPQFLRFYTGYTSQSLMDEFAVTFFSLVNSMFRLKAEEMIDEINAVTVGMADNSERQEVLSKLSKSTRGKHGILQEVRIVRNK